MELITYTTTKITISVIFALAFLMSSSNGNNNNNNKNVKDWGRGRWSFGPWPGGYNSTDCPFSRQNRTHHGPHGPAKIVVGGPNRWNFGFNYTDWALNNGPFYLNDVLVFKYAPPVHGVGHSVYLLPDLWSYMNCDLSRAQRLASPTQGGGKNGFEFKLTKWQPYYFACGEHNGVHCNLGFMKFFVFPIYPSYN